VQAIAFLLFLAFIVLMPALAVPEGRGDWLMRFSPFAGLGASISAWQLIVAFWPALALLVGAVALGRYFCGWLCPLGTTLDLGDWLIARFRDTVGRARTRRLAMKEAGLEFEHRSGRRIKYYILAGCLTAAFLGVAAFGLFDPLSIAVRSYVLVVHSYVAHGLLSLLSALGLRGLERGVASALGVETEPVFLLQGLTLLVLLGLLALGLVRRRFWCRYLCPLGATYALAGKRALTRRVVGDSCIECGRCADACPTGCISPDGRRTLNDECILCLNCQPVCPAGAVRFLAPTPAGQDREVELTRRGALTAVAAGLAAYPLYSIRPGRLLAKDDPLIRPPLSGKDLDGFLKKCLRCGQCMRACPTHVIQPAGLEAGIEGLWTPKLVPRLGYCIYECDSCGRACPSGAIPPFTMEQKHASAVGLAYIDRNRCIPWRGWQQRFEDDWVADKYNCGVCEEVCPVPGKAIRFRYEYVQPGGGVGRGRAAAGEGQELRLPVVVEDACVGCGFCESACPVVGKAAIRVSGGFRELPAPSGKPSPAVRTAEALPAGAGSLRLSGPKTTYNGAGELWDYIDGEGDLYLPFGFVRVTAATYTDGESQVAADLWEFQDPEGAYGAYAKDRQGEPVRIGDEGSALGSSVWARRGRYTIRVVNLGQAAPQDTLALARAAIDALGEEPAPRPEICRRLPREGLDPQSVLYMRDESPLWNLDLAEQFVPEGTLGIEQGVEAAYGVYDLRDDGRPAALLLVRYPDEARARRAADALAELRKQWGHTPVAGQPYPVFKAAEDSYGAVAASGPLLAAAFYMPTPEAGVTLLEGALP